MLRLHRGLVWSSFCLFPQDEVRGGVAAGAHLHDQVSPCYLAGGAYHHVVLCSLMNAICSFIGIYFNAKNRPHITLTKEEAKVLSR